MDKIYGNEQTPPIPRDPVLGTICVAPYEEGWHRAQSLG